jgi:ankyrin repeat protein
MSADLYSACAAGNWESVEAILARRPELARVPGGAENREPLLYVCYARKFNELPDAMLKIARRLLELGADANCWFMDGEWRETALYGASGVVRSAPLTKLLLERGADPNDEESLYHASEVTDLRCLRLLLEARPKPAWVSYCFGHKLWHDDIDGVRLYLGHGAPVNLPHQRGVLAGSTNLHTALKRRRSAAIVGLLMEAGGDVTLRDGDGFTAMQLAERMGQEEVADLLRRYGASEAPVTATDNFLAACWRGEPVRAPARLTEADHRMLPWAAEAGYARAVERMLEAGLDREAESWDGMTALHWGAFYGNAEIVDVCLRHGCALDHRNAYGGRALETARFGAEHRVREVDYSPVIRRLAAATPAEE